MAKPTNFHHRIPKDTALFLLVYDLLKPGVVIMCKEMSDRQEEGYWAGVTRGPEAREELEDPDRKTFEIWAPGIKEDE